MTAGALFDAAPYEGRLFLDDDAPASTSTTSTDPSPRHTCPACGRATSTRATCPRCTAVGAVPTTMILDDESETT